MKTKSLKAIALHVFVLLIWVCPQNNIAQESTDSTRLTIDRIFQSSDLYPEYFSQPQWVEDGQAYTLLEGADQNPEAEDIVRYETKSGKRSILISASQLTPKGEENPLSIASYAWSANKKLLLIFTNTRRVWRYNTKGDYWLLNRETEALSQLGKGLPESSLMFAKFSPDNNRVAYVSEHNLYVEDLTTHKITRLTADGSTDLINGTFDWAYEEEFFCRDGFRWSPDGSHIAYWQIDASQIKDFLMINNTDSLYSFTIPVEYPKVGQDPSSAKIGVVAADGDQTVWMEIPGDPKQHYLVRMIWDEDSQHFMVQQLNRKQNTNKIWRCNALSGAAQNIYTDRDEAWLDLVEDWMWMDEEHFTWLSEKDGWRHLYLISKDGTLEQVITRGDYDVISVAKIDTDNNTAYFMASPDNATQAYLYKIKMDGKSQAERITPENQSGTHSYNIAPDARYALHTWSNINTPPTTEMVSLPKHKSLRTLVSNTELQETMSWLDLEAIEFFQLTTIDQITMDGFIIKPPDFDTAKKYPVLFYVYGEPWGQTAQDAWGEASLWHKMMAQEGYLVITLDNRGTPAPKGRDWRKSIYRKIGVVNSRDQAMAAREIMTWPFVDSTRTAVWGWSGGGSMTLNLMFRYPEIYEAGMAVAPVSNQYFYDNIYQERYMGLKSENPEDFEQGSPVNFAKDLEGDLLIVHGTGDDNVHYQNTEVLINELVRHNKMFQVMPYPNRSHGIYEGENTSRHLHTLLRNYLMEHIEAGGK